MINNAVDIFADKGLIEANELAELLQNNSHNIKLIDGTFVMPNAPKSAQELFTERRIDNAVHFDIDEIADTNAMLAHTIPSPEKFAEGVSKLGISNDDFVVVYDQFGIAMAAARVWWMFRLYGHDKVCVLNGGLPYWQATGHPVVEGPAESPESADFIATFRPELVKQLDGMKEAVSQGCAVVDARSNERFSGRAEEFREGLRSGHIPGSVNLPFMSLINPEDGRLESADQLEPALAPFIPANDIISTCGSGVTACVLALAFYNIGRKDVPVYDGSWTEWGQESTGTEVATL